MKKRGSGILMHITSLPSHYGIGDLGPEAYKFADFLSESGQMYWQVLPLTPTDPVQGNSPYSSPSAFACNPLIVSPDLLVRDGYLDQEDLEPLPGSPPDRVNYTEVITYKERLLDKAYRRFKEMEDKSEFGGFRHQNSHWLDNFALFTAIKERDSNVIWSDWPVELRDRRQDAIQALRTELEDSIEKARFIQFVAFKQWHALKDYCNERQIQMVGDIPIYVSYDSADVWANSEIFRLDTNKKPTHVAGVPPDYFSSTGQLWGNPVYNWEVCKRTGFQWWLRRMVHTLSLFDIVRIDHLRGLVAYWEVPAGAKTAVNGRWVDVPSKEFFDTMVNRFHEFPIIAEDLGVITQDVKDLMEHYGFPGMKVLLFAFSDNDPRQSYLPHNYERNSVVYTGTHDNNTARGWFENGASPHDRERLGAYVGHEITADSVSWDLIRVAMQSVADMAIVPMQDLLGLGEEARMNLPGTLEGHWGWRLLPGRLTPDLADALRGVTHRYART